MFNRIYFVSNTFKWDNSFAGDVIKLEQNVLIISREFPDCPNLPAFHYTSKIYIYIISNYYSDSCL